MSEPTRTGMEVSREPVLAVVGWSALVLALGRATVLMALELTHHGDGRLAVLRLADAASMIALRALALVLLAGFALWVGTVGGRQRLRRALAVLALAVGAFLFLTGRLDADRSQQIGTATNTGLGANAAAAVAAVVLGAFVLLARTRFVRRFLASAWLAAPVPFVLLGLAFVGTRFIGGLGSSMALAQVRSDLASETWEVLRAHPGGGPAPGVVRPSAGDGAQGAARRALLLPPPARVRRQLPDSAAGEWLVGAVGIDHAVLEEVGASVAGHTVRFRVRLDGALVFEQQLVLGASAAWVPMGGQEGFKTGPEALLELETALLAPDGSEVTSAEPLAVGLSDLRLVRRERVARTRASRESPNVVLVLLDTLRADRTSAYGYGRRTTPNLDALAARGILFEEACATASWTWPSTASILTGLLPEEHGVQDATTSSLSQSLDTLPEAMQRAGLTTAGWSGSPLIVPDKGFDQGFEFFDASKEDRIRRSDTVLPGALDWLGRAGEWRFFLYLHLMEPHAPLVPLPEGRRLFAADVPRDFDPRKFIDYQWELQREGFSADGTRNTESVVPPQEQRWIAQLYDACVWSADHYLGQLVARLEELDLLDDTIIAVTSDHGEELFDHGLLAHAHTLHRELVRVPLVLAGPGIPRGERVASVRSGAELGPTLARLGGATIEGLTAAQDLLADAPDRPVLFSTQQGWWKGQYRLPLHGMRRGSSVLHFAPRGGPWGTPKNTGAGEVSLFDLDEDPGELHDLAPGDPQRAAAMRNELLQILAGLESRRVEGGAPPDQATLDMLRDLGYVGK